jgi:hypothetical protein
VSDCGACTGETNIKLCPGCRDKLTEDLREVESMVGALWASAARMDVGNGSVGTSGHSSPSDPTNGRAYDAGRTLNVILTGWTRILGYHQPHAVKAANTLLEHINEVREQEWAPDLKQELHDALKDCLNAMDRRAPRIFAGICPGQDNGEDCGTPVYTPQGKTKATCQTCNLEWDTDEWRARALEAAGYHSGTAAELSRILSDPVKMIVFPQNKISVWVNRGKLTHVNEWDRWMAGIFNKPIPAKRYQVRKVRNLWERAQKESEARRERMAA